MEIGTLNQRITFLENRVVTDEIGNHTDTRIPHSAKSKLDAVCNRQPNLVSRCHIQHHQCYTGLSAQGLSETYCRSQKGRTK